jgi:hypothetical protein
MRCSKCDSDNRGGENFAPIAERRLSLRVPSAELSISRQKNSAANAVPD